MCASSFVYRLALAGVACLASIGASRLHAQEVDLPESIRLALARYADLAPLAVTWTQTTEATPIGREKIADMLGEITHDGSSVQQLAFHDGQIYVRWETKGASSWPPRTDEFAFDRSRFYAAHNLFYTGAPDPGDPKDRPYLHKWLPKNDDPQASYYRNDYFRAAGVRLPARTTEIISSWHPLSELLALLAEGGRIKAIGPIGLDGRPLFRVQVMADKLQDPLAPPQRYDFYFDPKQGYAVRRLEIHDEVGRLRTRSDCTDFEQLSGRLVWMPRRCRVEEYALTATTQEKENLILDVLPSLLYATKIQVNAFDVKPWADDRFQLKYVTPGVYVNDASFPEITGKDGIVYQIPANPQRLDEVIAVRRAFYQARLRAEKKARPLRVLFLGLNGMGLAGIAVYFFVRRRKKAGCTR